MELTSGVIYGLFFMFLIFGALLGLKRGLVKATIRIITILISCVAVIFLVTPITNAILTTDISSTGLTIGDIPVTTISDTMIAYIGQLLGVGTLLSASPTLLALINAIPKIVLNLILFILLFFITKGILYFADMFINKIFIKKNSDKPKRRILGAVVGGVQGIICFLFCLIPIAGSMNLINDSLTVITSPTNSETQLVAFASTPTSEEPQSNSFSTEQIKKTATSTLDVYNDLFIIKMFNAIGYDNLTNSVFDKLTTIEIDTKTSTTIRKESITIAKLVTNFDKLKNIDIAHFSNENEAVANQMIDDAFSSPLIGGITNELISGVADAWAGTNPTDFMGVAKPELDEHLVESLDSLLLSLRTNTITNTQKDLKVIVKTLKVAADHDITSSINTGNIDLVVSAFGSDGAMEDIIATLSTGNATKHILPSFIEFGLSYGYSAVGIEGVQTNIVKSADEVNWETEPEILGNLFEGVSSVYQSSKGEGSILKRLDLIGFAKVLDSIRDSELLKDSSQVITVHFLSSSLLSGVDCDTFISYVQNDNTYENMDFTVMFTTLKSSAEIASEMKDITTGTGEVSSLDSSNVGDLIDGLTGDDTTKEVLKELASEDNLENSGVDKATAGAVNTLVESVADYDTSIDGAVQPPSSTEEKENATNAVQGLLIASKNAKTDDPEQQIFETEESMEQFIDNMLSSPFIWAVSIEKGVELGFKTDSKTNLSETEQEWLEEILAKKILNETCTEEQAGKLKLMFYPVI